MAQSEPRPLFIGELPPTCSQGVNSRESTRLPPIFTEEVSPGTPQLFNCSTPRLVSVPSSSGNFLQRAVKESDSRGSTRLPPIFTEEVSPGTPQLFNCSTPRLVSVPSSSGNFLQRAVKESTVEGQQDFLRSSPRKSLQELLNSSTARLLDWFPSPLHRGTSSNVQSRSQQSRVNKTSSDLHRGSLSRNSSTLQLLDSSTGFRPLFIGELPPTCSQGVDKSRVNKTSSDLHRGSLSRNSSTLQLLDSSTGFRPLFIGELPPTCSQGVNSRGSTRLPPIFTEEVSPGTPQLFNCSTPRLVSVPSSSGNFLQRAVKESRVESQEDFLRSSPRKSLQELLNSSTARLLDWFPSPLHRGTSSNVQSRSQQSRVNKTSSDLHRGSLSRNSSTLQLLDSSTGFRPLFIGELPPTCSQGVNSRESTRLPPIFTEEVSPGTPQLFNCSTPRLVSVPSSSGNFL